MIFNYGFSMVGKSHITKGTCCQDSHCIKQMSNGWYIGAIADGVGSAKNSHIGSKIAVDTVVSFCNECMPWDYNLISIKSMIRTAFNYAYKQILKESESTGEPIESYDTTLSLVIYDGNRIVYGHSGDGAIIGLTTFGDYVEITKPQKAADQISVLPLRSGYTQWEIDTYDEDLIAVLLVTDGMLDTLCPYLLRDEGATRVYVPLGAYFADPRGIPADLKLQKRTKENIKEFLIADENYKSRHFYKRLFEIYKKHIPNEAETIIKQIIALNYPIILMQNQQDDKTVVGLINTELEFDEKPANFYEEPDWVVLKEAWNRKAYPHLYKDKAEETITSHESTIVSENADNDQKQSDRTNKQKAENNSDCINETRADCSNNLQQDDIVVSSKKESKQSLYKGNDREKNQVEEKTMQKHEKPQKKSLIGRIGDLFE